MITLQDAACEPVRQLVTHCRGPEYPPEAVSSSGKCTNRRDVEGEGQHAVTMGSRNGAWCLPVMGALVLLLSSAAFGAQAADQLQRADIGGHPRHWLVHLPSGYRPGWPLPLVIAFHGHGSAPRWMVRLTGLDHIADRDDFIVVYPAGVQRSWAAGVNSPADRAGVDDVAFTAALLDRLEKQYAIDSRHIVLTGFSNGAHLTQLLGCRLANRISTIVPVSGTLAAPEVESCHPARPLTVVAFHGTGDPIDPFGGGRINVPGGGNVLSALANIEDWAKRDHCGGPAVVKPEVVPKTAVYLVTHTYRDCLNDARVVLYEIVGGGHTWPGGPQYLPAAFIGAATHVVSAGELIGELAAGKSLSTP